MYLIPAMGIVIAIIGCMLGLSTSSPVASRVAASVVRQQQDAKRAILGKPVTAIIGGHLEVVVLTDYSAENDTYWGEAHRNRSMDSSERCPCVKSVTSLRPWPYAARPDQAFQFCTPGDVACEQAVRDIAAGIQRGPMSTEPHVVNPQPEQPKPQIPPLEERKKKKKP